MAAFAALAGNRRAEFLELTWPHVDEAMGLMRIQRAKQQDGQTVGRPPANTMPSVTKTA